MTIQKAKPVSLRETNGKMKLSKIIIATSINTCCEVLVLHLKES